jgi:hypothetical protein
MSDQLREAAAAERALVARRVEDLREQARRMRECAEAVEVDLAASTRLLHQLDEMLGDAPQLSMTPSDETLRGHRLRDVAIQVLKRYRGGYMGEAAAVHYREWYELVVHDGHRVAGKDPVATFLTQVSRAPEIERVGHRSGRYRLRVA